MSALPFNLFYISDSSQSQMISIAYYSNHYFIYGFPNRQRLSNIHSQSQTRIEAQQGIVASDIQEPNQPGSQSRNQEDVPSARRRIIMKNEQTQIQSAKKNGQFNILNQALNFLDNCFSAGSILDEVIKKIPGRQAISSETVDKLRSIVLSVIRLINCRRGRRYISCSILSQYFIPSQFAKNITNIEAKLSETGLMSLEELCWVFRTVVYKFIRTNSVSAVLTSWRIKPIGKQAHLSKRRSVIKALSSIRTQ